jgi:hypothetical protein
MVDDICTVSFEDPGCAAATAEVVVVLRLALHGRDSFQICLARC